MPGIRPIAVGLPIRGDHVLVLEGADAVKDEAFHRAIGGGIEFGETADQAVRREFLEEVGVTLEATTLLGVVEDRFTYEGRPGHQIAFVFAVESAELDALAPDAELHVLDEGSPIRWTHAVHRDRPLYPEGVGALLLAEIDRRRGR